jgi:hypothetical protein
MGTSGRRIALNGSLADASVNPVTQHVGVTEVTAVLTDH